VSAVGVSSKQRWAARREEGEGNWEAFLHYVAAPVLLFVLGASTNSRSGSNRARVRLKGRALVLGSRAALVLTFEGASQCRRWHLQPSRDRSHAEALGQPLADVVHFG